MNGESRSGHVPPEGVDPIRGEYERQVRELVELSTSLEQASADQETIARAVHAARSGLAERFKAITPELLRTRLRTRTLARYGNPIGPTIDDLRSRGKSWRDIIASATRPGTGDFFE
jgi:hypothetical protein